MPATHRPREPVPLSGGLTARPWQLPPWPEVTVKRAHPAGLCTGTVPAGRRYPSSQSGWQESLHWMAPSDGHPTSGLR